MDKRQNPYYEPSCPEDEPETGYSRRAVPDDSISPRANAGQNGRRRGYEGRRMLRGAAGRAENSAERGYGSAERQPSLRQSHHRDDIADILSEVERNRHARTHENRGSESSSVRSETPVGSRMRQETVRPERQPRSEAMYTRRPDAAMHTASAGLGDTETVAPKPRPDGRKKRKSYSPTDILKFFIPWRGDSVFECCRKIVFSTAIVVVGVCSFLISDYYIDLYKSNKAYQELQAQIEAARANRGFSEISTTEDPATGKMIEWLDMNEYALSMLPINPDLVGLIRVPGTKATYPVVQKQKLSDPNENPNDYYLNRTFTQERSRSGCIFMDFRNHFDEVVDHRRVVENSNNVFIYGHNMGNGTMFGTLWYYVNNPSFYSQNPIVEYSSLYKDYQFKIFSVFIVDGEDYTSEYAFDAWNGLDFEDEDAFYDYVNEAKKRTIISNDVDVKYGDQLFSLFTCNTMIKNGKLILMCREVRAGEDPKAGTENATLNENVLYPKAYYDAGHPVNYDPKKFVPFGPET